ncbi:hypothetical protein [Bizionia sp. APA-3]|uniref:hypothetical protein n=1 Tax=Bizionia sp. APA-3 TaxID=1861784 RepID=UPI00080508AD|nr:hypothetical protein [Bizionia sp. APA-3]OBX22315.1 hypothetical protein BAA08_09465 [Bizionia sp. APA-3]
MKQTILILVTVLLSTVGFSQNRDDHHEKIKTLKVAYITEKLNLTQTEAQNFWPIYNKFEEDHNKLRNDVSDKRKDIDMENLTESNAKSLIKEMELLYEKRYQSYQKYMKDLQTVLPAKKVVLLKKVEDDFKRKIV